MTPNLRLLGRALLGCALACIVALMLAVTVAAFSGRTVSSADTSSFMWWTAFFTIVGFAVLISTQIDS